MRTKKWRCLVLLSIMSVLLVGYASAGDLEYALSVAAMERSTNEVKELIHKGADPNSANGSGVTILMEVCGEGFLDMAQVLIDNGAKIGLKDKRGRDALMEATSKGRLPVAKFLVEKGADVKAKCAAGVTSLALAELGGHKDVVEFLKSQGAE